MKPTPHASRSLTRALGPSNILEGLSVVKAIWSFESNILAGTLREEGRKALAGHAATNKVAVNEYLMAVCRRLDSDFQTTNQNNWCSNQDTSANEYNREEQFPDKASAETGWEGRQRSDDITHRLPAKKLSKNLNAHKAEGSDRMYFRVSGSRTPKSF